VTRDRNPEDLANAKRFCRKGEIRETLQKFGCWSCMLDRRLVPIAVGPNTRTISDCFSLPFLDGLRRMPTTRDYLAG
jgi:hypothetical protein